MKKAFHLLESFKHGGAENVACNYAIVLKELGIDSIFIAKDSSIEYKQNIQNKGFNTLSEINERNIKSADYIFVHSNQNLLRILPYFFMLKRKKIKVIYIQHLFYSESKFLFLSFLINLLCTNFIQITPITEEYIKKYINIKVSFIPNFYLNKYNINDYPTIRKKVRKELNIEDDCKIVMFSAILKKGKGLSDFIELASNFRADNNIKFIIVGDGPERYIAEQYNGNNLKLVGLVSDVEQYLIASDIYFFPSKKEMLPMALIEAINTNKYILATKNPVTDFLLNTKTYNTIQEACDNIKDNNIPSSFKVYDKSYALNILNKLILD